MNYADYIRQFPDGKKVVLLTIDPDGTPIRISSARFSTLPSDPDLPNVLYSSLISDGGVPRMHRSLRDMWGSGAVSSWGPVVLSTWDYKSGSAAALDLRTEDLYGKKIEIRLSGPNHLTTFNEALVTIIGYLRRKSGTVGKGITIEVADRKSLLDNIVPTERYDASSENIYFPSSNDGKVKQIVLGKWNNVPCTLINKNTHTYEVSDRRFPIKDIIAVYNNGNSVSFTKDLPNNQFTVTVPPSSNEVITAKVEGVKDAVSGNLYTTLQQFMTWMLEEFTDINPSTEAVFGAGIPTDDAQYIFANEDSLASHMDRICQSIIATWFFSPLDILQVKLIDEPVAGGPTLNKKKWLQDVSWEEVEEIFYKVPYRYDSNAAKLTELGASVGDPELEIWLREDYRENIEEDAAILTAYPNATVAEPIQTFFVGKAAAQAVAQRALGLFGVQRYIGNVNVPYVSPALSLLDSVELVEADVVTGDCLITEITEDLVSATPTLELRVWK